MVHQRGARVLRNIGYMRAAHDGFFDAWGESLLAAVAALANRRRFGTGVYLWRRLDVADRQFALVIDGRLEVRRGDELIALIEPGNVVGISALTGGGHTADVRAADDGAQCLIWDATAMRPLLLANPESLLGALVSTTRLVSKLNDELELHRRTRASTSARKVAWHVQRLLPGKDESEQAVAISLDELSARTGLNRTTVSTCIEDLRDIGIVSKVRKKRALIIEDVERLAAVADGRVAVPRGRSRTSGA